MSNWTRDRDGQYCNWIEPPYRGPGGQLRLLVDGERPDVLELEEHIKRIQEYYRLTWRDAAAKMVAPEQGELL